MESSGNEMAYFIIVLSIVVFIGSFFVDKIDFKKPRKNDKVQHWLANFFDHLFKIFLFVKNN